MRYGGIEAVRALRVAVAPGERVSLLGANGAGKSSTLRALAGLTRAEGSVRLDGEVLDSLDAAERVSRGLSLVPEGRAIVPGLSVEETLRLGAFSHRHGPTVAEGLADVYNLFPRLAERHRQDAATLSGGEQQMLAVGRALLARPRVLLLDEPSLGLAPKMVSVILDAVVAIAEAGVGVLLVEQNTQRALPICHRAYVLRGGALVAEGDARAIGADPALRKAYLGA